MELKRSRKPITVQWKGRNCQKLRVYPYILYTAVYTYTYIPYTRDILMMDLNNSLYKQ